MTGVGYLSSGFTRLVPSVVTVMCCMTAVWLMAIATKRIEMGMAYAAWAGSSAALTAVIGIVWFGEALSAIKAIGICTAIFWNVSE